MLALKLCITVSSEIEPFVSMMAFRMMLPPPGGRVLKSGLGPRRYFQRSNRHVAIAEAAQYPPAPLPCSAIGFDSAKGGAGEATSLARILTSGRYLAWQWHSPQPLVGAPVLNVSSMCFPFGEPGERTGTTLGAFRCAQNQQQDSGSVKRSGNERATTGSLARVLCVGEQIHHASSLPCEW